MCDVSENPLSGKAVNLWAEAFLNTKSCQITAQVISILSTDYFDKTIQLSKMGNSKWLKDFTSVVLPLALVCMKQSLNEVITKMYKESYFLDLLIQLSNKLNGLNSLLGGKVMLGISVESVKVNMVSLSAALYAWLVELMVLFWVEGGFIDYDPYHFPIYRF